MAAPGLFNYKAVLFNSCSKRFRIVYLKYEMPSLQNLFAPFSTHDAFEMCKLQIMQTIMHPQYNQRCNFYSLLQRMQCPRFPKIISVYPTAEQFYSLI